ncbi:DUF397 domain-containing protein [Streptomyces nigrescens]
MSSISYARRHCRLMRPPIVSGRCLTADRSAGRGIVKPEIVSAFRKSSYSGQEGDCVEVAHTADGGRVVRDSKDPAGPHIALGVGAWASFIETLKTDHYAAL